MEALNWLLEHSVQLAALLSCVWGAVLVVAKLTPTKADDVAIEHMKELGSIAYELLQSIAQQQEEGAEDESIEVDFVDSDA